MRFGRGATFDHRGATVFWLLVGAALVGLGVSQWRNPRTSHHATISTWHGLSRPLDPTSTGAARRRLGILTVAVGVLVMAIAGLALVFDL
ncbi:MAG: hypothetical protein AB7L91_04615 [Dehalococcoidia bacterium]